METSPILYTFYDHLRDRMILKNKIKGNSILVSFFSIKSNETYKLLSEASIDITAANKYEFEVLETSGFIRQTDTNDKYAITAVGIWEIEKQKNLLHIDQLLKDIDKKFFDIFETDAVLSDKEKVIILSFIAIRSFSVDSALDLKSGDTALAKMEEIISKSFDLLKQNKCITKLTFAELFGKQGNEHPVSHVIRHTDKILKKTRGIYQTLGSQKYYLNIGTESSISTNQLSYLFGLIFKNKMSNELKDSVSKFLEDTSHNDSMYLFNLDSHRFASPKYDVAIKEALDVYYDSKNKYSEKSEVQ